MLRWEPVSPGAVLGYRRLYDGPSGSLVASWGPGTREQAQLDASRCGALFEWPQLTLEEQPAVA